MGAIKRDLERITCNKAKELAEKRYGREFNDLSSSLQMQVWMEAEQEAADYFACQADAIYDRMREEKLFSGENGHKSQEEWEAFSAEQELQRRLGK